MPALTAEMDSDILKAANIEPCLHLLTLKFNIKMSFLWKEKQETDNVAADKNANASSPENLPNCACGTP